MKPCAVLAVLIFSIIFILTSAFSSVAFAQSPNIMELQRDWKLIAADKVAGDDALVSQANFDVSQWYPVPHMPATVLQILEDDGVYQDLYFGTNLTKPGELWKQDWWYRTTFVAPAGSTVNTLIFKGINYRAEIWLNGHKIARRDQAVGMYNEFEFDVTKWIVPGGANVLAVKVTPERAVIGEGGVELGDSWWDWINWKYIGLHDAEKKLDIPFVPDRNAGVWKRVYISST